MALEEVKVRRIWKEHLEDLYNIDTEEQVVVYIHGFDWVWRRNYFGGELIEELRLR